MKRTIRGTPAPTYKELLELAADLYNYFDEYLLATSRYRPPAQREFFQRAERMIRRAKSRLEP